jgi:pimeloyl-ACP methyl ester carboxylesterase
VPTLVTEQGIVHYETLGRGRPVLLLHGWLGSWALWRNTIEILSKEFRVYALDFFGFGESFDRTSDFTVSNFVESVNQFMDRLGIIKAPLVGHSMGGTVSLAAAVRFPEKVVKVTVVGSPIQGSSLNPLLKLAGFRGTARVAWMNPAMLRMFIKYYAYFIAKDGKMMSKMMMDDFQNITVESFFQSIGTLRDTDLRPQIANIKHSVMGIYGKHDVIVHPKQSEVLKLAIPHSKIAWFEGSGHFPMLDEPQIFHDTLIDFLKNG